MLDPVTPAGVGLRIKGLFISADQLVDGHVADGMAGELIAL